MFRLKHPVIPGSCLFAKEERESISLLGTRAEKLEKLLSKVQELVAKLDDHNDLVVHRHLNQFYFMHKSEEVKVLIGQYHETRTRMNAIIDQLTKNSEELYRRWRTDVRWFANYMNESP